MTACTRGEPAQSGHPLAPSTTTTSPPRFLLSGTVAEEGRPIGNARVHVTAVLRRQGGGGAAWPAGQDTTDREGRYRIALRDFMDSLAERPILWVVADIDGYVQPCPSTTRLTGDDSLDVRLTSVANLSSARPSAGPNLRTVSGVVFEMTAEGRRPVQGAGVGWETDFDGFVAWTLSDDTGFYFLCDLPRSNLSGLSASKGLATGAARAPAGGDAVVDIEIRPR